MLTTMPVLVPHLKSQKASVDGKARLEGLGDPSLAKEVECWQDEDNAHSPAPHAVAPLHVVNELEV